MSVLILVLTELICSSVMSYLNTQYIMVELLKNELETGLAQFLIILKKYIYYFKIKNCR